ncbi:MAG: ABC transporter permease subunit [Alphaproteobacteria bacterium]|nr:ABC transporter permease subunit [Alphaproteobacteria bacterium]
MSGLWLVARRELGAYINTVWGWVVVAAVLVIDGLLFNAFAMGDTARYSSDVLEDFFFFSFGTTTVAAVLLTMRLIAEERQTGTIVLMDSSPLSDWQVVGGKFTSAMIFLGGMTLLTLYMPALIFVNGKVSVGHIFSGYLGLLLVGGATAAIGTFGSALARSQFVAAILSGVITVVMLVSWLLGRVTDPPLADVFSYMSLFDRHFQPFQGGRINTEDVVFYLSVTFVFLLLSTRVLSARRWR